MNRTKRQHHNSTPLYQLCALLLFLVFNIFNIVFADSSHHVVIITSSDSVYQHQTALRILENLDATDTRTMIVSADDIDTASRNEKTLYVAIGDYAIEKLHAFDHNAMTLRLSGRKSQDRIYNSTKSDLITAQPDCRHIQLIKSLNPEWSTAGVLSSVGSLDIAAALTKCAIRYNINLQVYAITDKSDLLETLEAAVEGNKVLLAIIDPLIYNSHTVKNILLTAYRHRKPVIGYSDSFVQAGAVAAIFTSPDTAGDRASKIITDFFSNSWQFDKNIYYTDGFSTSTNEQVAASLEIELPDTESIRKNIIRMENMP